ncbi:Helix-turn-helix domain-containing protein [Haladaptatus litoreus]|uniref:Helix-turn-helix domain-containing protein n=1 Tax=Haladaptatus litoreus TaxID=553468 RepID=A0A1N7BMI6_9EURY|nr:helix-turn-helix domain-containing protein [Haladaptatus litoreus]SIR52433.1 Helix-turn-helix domain-containing protein [Haladaptatus litoreus]
MNADDRNLSPEEAFSLLGNDTRIGIIQTLWEADEPLSFSELHDRVGLRDSGQFNYHLNKLVGLFVRQKDGKYELPFAGFRVIGAILSGTYTQRAESTTYELDSPCVKCETMLEAEYDEEMVTVRCPTCDEQWSKFGFPPGAFEGRDTAELPRTFERWLRNVFLMMADGVCLNCSGRTTKSLVTESKHFEQESEIGVEFVCERCNDHGFGSIGSYILQHPAVVAFHYEHGINLREQSAWELEWLIENEAEIIAEIPLLVEYTVELDGDELTVTVDDELTVEVEDM